MCCFLATRQPVQQKYLKNMQRINPHLSGFVVAKDGELIMHKGFEKFHELWQALRPYNNLPKLVHFRWASVGEITVENSHPFFITPELAMVHNGTIPLRPAKGDDRSDTRLFVDLILKKLYMDDPNFLKNIHITWLLSKSINNSKIAFLDDKGEITIINKELGEEKNKVWYSNTDYRSWPGTIGYNRHGNLNNVCSTNSPYSHLYAQYSKRDSDAANAADAAYADYMKSGYY